VVAAVVFGLLIATLDRRRVRDIERRHTHDSDPHQDAEAARGRYLWRRNH